MLALQRTYVAYRRTRRYGRADTRRGARLYAPLPLACALQWYVYVRILLPICRVSSTYRAITFHSPTSLPYMT